VTEEIYALNSLTYLISNHLKFVVDKLAVRQIFHASTSVFLNYPAHSFIKVMVCNRPHQLELYNIFCH